MPGIGFFKKGIEGFYSTFVTCVQSVNFEKYTYFIPDVIINKRNMHYSLLNVYVGWYSCEIKCDNADDDTNDFWEQFDKIIFHANRGT